MPVTDIPRSARAQYALEREEDVEVDVDVDVDVHLPGGAETFSRHGRPNLAEFRTW